MAPAVAAKVNANVNNIAIFLNIYNLQELRESENLCGISLGQLRGLAEEYC